MMNRIYKLISLAKAHVFLSALAVAVVLGGGWWTYSAFASTTGETRYVLGTVLRGTIVSTVSASGQVSASNQVDLQAKTAGELVTLNVKVGQTVSAGSILGSVDLGQAGYDLESAKIAYNKAVSSYPSDISDAQTKVDNAHTSAVAKLITSTSSFTDTLDTLNTILTGYLKDNTSYTKTERDAISKATKSYYSAKDAVKSFQTQYAAMGETGGAIEQVVSNAYNTSLTVLTATKDVRDGVSYLRDHETADTSANDAYTSANSEVSDATTLVSDIASVRDGITTANTALAQLQDSSGTTDIRSAQLSMLQKQESYSDHFIRAPFDGIIASVAAQKGDTLSSGATVATLITKQKIAEVSLNEVDAAKVKVGDKVTLTFDAIDNLSLTGSVAEVDLIGTVEQGVVSYTIKIGFDMQDERVKPGMTVNAAIQTDTRQDVLTAPSSAVKTQNGMSYVQVFDPPLRETGETGGVTSTNPPQQVAVEVGISDDTSVEILSGLSEGQQIVTRTSSGVTTNTPAATTNRAGGFRAPGAGIRL